jgi:ABC-2 type transport system permease protein
MDKCAYILVAVLGEIRKGILVSWAYRTNLLSAVLTLGVILCAVISMMTSSTDIDQARSLLVGYLTWMYASFAIGSMGQGLRAEIQAGTLEQVAMSPVPLAAALCARVLANFVVTTILVVLVNGAVGVVFGVQVPLHWQGLPVLLLTLLGILGFGFVIAGVTLVSKQVASFTNLIQNALLFLNGTIVPLRAMPTGLVVLARTLPSTQGIAVLRRVVLDGQALVSVWQDKSLVRLAFHSAIYLAVGWVCFAFCERAAKRQGSLGQY